MVIVTSVGPRIAFFGRVGGPNLLYWDDGITHRRGEWCLYGGHRLWIARPGADESEETYEPDNEPCRVEISASGVAVSAPSNRSRIEKTLRIEVDHGVWTVVHQLRNTGDMLWSGAAWALTCTRPERSTRYRIPIDGGDPGWDVLTMIIPRAWGGGHTSRVDDPQFVLGEATIDFRSDGTEAKRMFRVPRGRLDMTDLRGTFVKCAALVRGASYPLDTNVAVYLAPQSFMVELETMSPVQTLPPGQSFDHVETWSFTAR
jgi:hypothetical protein